ncbi:MAG TPA: hemolysin family protein [Woeseiaceae bacterium]|nr:hemolysin family protein [Woeseiaceae bacterium]
MQNLGFTVLAFVFVLMNAFFVAAEFAIVKLRYTKAEELAETAGTRGRILYKVHSHLDEYLSACQLGITLASLGLGWIGEPAFARLIEPLLGLIGITAPEVVHGVAFIAAFATISYLHIVVGELAPKSVAIRQPEPVSLWTAVPLFSFYWLMYPFIWLLNGSANLLLRAMGVDLVRGEEEAHSVSELKKVLRASHRHGELGGDSAILLKRAFELDELTAGDVMRPDEEMVMLDVHDELPGILATIRSHRYSRYPVYEGEPDNVIGILHVKDLIAELEQPAGSATDLRHLVKPALIISSAMSAVGILKEFQHGYPHFAIVVDEYGTMLGFVTLDHVVEVLVGTIEDEFSHRRPDWIPQPNGSYVGHGSLSIYSLERLLNIEISPFPDVNSVGGLVMDRLERIPRVGDKATFEHFELEVLQMEGPRIVTVAVTPLAWQEYDDQTG